MNRRWLFAVLFSWLLWYPAWLFTAHGISLQSAGLSTNDFELLCRWDCLIYAEISKDPKPAAFFPLFPVVSHYLKEGLAGVGLDLTHRAVVLIVSNFFSVFAVLLGFVFGTRHWREEPPFWLGFGKNTWVLASSLAFFQHNHFWIQGYPEPLFVALFFLGLIGLIQSRWLLAAAALGCLAVTRPQGLWVMGITAGLSVVGMGLPRRYLILLVAPFLGFLYWNHFHTGNWFYFLAEQRKWGRTFDFISGLKNHLPKFEDSRFFAYVGLALVAMNLRPFKKPPVQMLLLGSLLAMIEIPIWFGGYYSYSRFIGSCLPLFILLAPILAARPKLFWAWCLWNLVRLMVFATTMVFGGWAG